MKNFFVIIYIKNKVNGGADCMNVGNRIKFFRLLRGISVNALAKSAGVSQSYLRDVELGNKNPTVSFIEILCQTLDISLVDFFNENNNQSIEEHPLIKKIYGMSKEEKDALMHLIEVLKK